MAQAHPLKAYLEASNETLPAFATRVGLSVDQLKIILSRSEALGIKLARRISVATGGAVVLGDLCSPNQDEFERGIVVELQNQRTTSSLDVDRLISVLTRVATTRLETEIREPEKMSIELAAEAAVHTYDALAGITTRHGSDRLQQALLPVLEETLKDCSGRAPNQNHLQEMAAEIAHLYNQ